MANEKPDVHDERLAVTRRDFLVRAGHLGALSAIAPAIGRDLLAMSDRLALPGMI